MSIARVSETRVRAAETAQARETARAARRPAASGTNRRRPPSPVKIADAYLLRHVVEATVRSLFWFAGLLLTFAVITAAAKFAKTRLPFADSFWLIAYQMPRIFVFTLPMSVLQGTVQTFSDLSSKGELTALWAGGMSFPRMLRAPLLWGVFLGGIAFWMQETVVPEAEKQKEALVARQIGTVLKAQTNFTYVDKDPGDGSVRRIIQAGRFDPRSGVLQRPRIQIFNRDRQISFQIRAERAEWNIEKGEWKFYNGHSTLLRENSFPVKNPFRELEVKVNSVPDPKAMRPGAMTLRQHLKKGDFEMVSIAELTDYIETLKERLSTAVPGVSPAEVRRLMNGATFGIHDKIATPLICLALILVGAPLGVRPQRTSGGFAMGLSLLVILLYYVTWALTSQLGKAGAFNPYFLAYLPFGITLLIGLAMVFQKSR
ncbi:MAG TPA: LptF/LptG family permease [Abditibacteriaceae bacterium]|nr:LptF/LptG family permease [Abditibacteriaceae bacterium]